MNDKPRNFLPRDGAGSFSLPPETGAIKRMVGLDGFMEIYSVHATYRVKTPDHLDPDRVVPNMPWSQSAHSNAGASNPIVARIFLQAIEAMGNWSLRNGNAEAIKRYLHTCKEEAVICEATYKNLKPAYDAAVTQVNDCKLKTQRNMVECPSLPTLRDDATAFLTSAKRALQAVGDVFNQFYAADGKKPLVNNANFSFGIARLENSQPLNQAFIDYLRKVEPVTMRFVDLRNGLEHQSERDFTAIENFQLTPKAIVPPSWKREGFAGDGAVLEEMHVFIQFLIEFCEHVFFFGLMDNIAPNFPIGFLVEQLPENEIDAECPIRYRIMPRFR